jgi:hypothetical protein
MIAADPRAARPGVALRPIGKIGDLTCRELKINHETGKGDEGLLRRYSPIFVNLPGITEEAPKPYPDGANDYQPNSVDVFFDSISSVRQAPRGLLGWLNIVYTAVSYVLLGLPALLALLGAPVELVLGMLTLAVVNTVVALIAFVPGWRWLGTPSDVEGLQAATTKKGAGQQYSMTTFSKSKVPNAMSAWANYRGVLSNKAELGDIVVYGRALPVEHDEHVAKVLQYWLFYYYNDWWNTHEADWEVAMVYLGHDGEPVAAACSSHLSGTWRPWAAFEGVGQGQDHPKIYIARGSHAMYFNIAGGVHYAVLRQPWAVFDFSGQLLVKGSRDAVGPATEAPATYRLEVMPVDPEKDVVSGDAWTRWWWLRFEGRWGQRDGILSPAIQEDKLRWDRPVEWARDHCAADSSSWDESMPGPSAPAAGARAGAAR